MTGTFSQAYTDALVIGDASAAGGVIDDALAAGIAPAAIQSFVIAPAMVTVGELWASQRITVADEHLATAVSQRALIRLFEVMNTGSGRAPTRERVLLAAVEGQRHVLGLRMVADVLEAAGHDVMYLGENIPVHDLRGFVAHHRPAVVGLAVGIESDVHHLADALCAIHEVAPETRIMLGGRGIPSELWDVGYPRVENTVGVAELVEDLLAAPPQELPPVVLQLRDPAHPAARHHSDGQDLAFRDPLTGLADLRGFENHLQVLVADPATAKGALMTLDVDAFQAINHRCGHPAGDRVLAAIAEVIKDSIRAVDVAARIGGDEFAVTMPGASVALAGRIGDRIRARVADTIEPRVSVSVGVAAFCDDARGAVLAADTALHQAKATGGDCVVGAPAPAPVEEGFLEPRAQEGGRAELEGMSYAGVVIADADLRILQVDGEVFRRHGYDIDGWSGRLLFDALPPEAMDVIGPRWEAAAAGDPQAFDYRSLDASTTYWVQLTPIRGPGGDVTMVLAVMQDVTARLRVVAELARSEARLNESERLVGVGSWELDVSTGAITYSRGVATLLGVAPEVDLDLVTYRELVHPDDRRIMMASIDACVRDGSGSCEYRIVRTDGTERLLVVSGVCVLDADGGHHLRGAMSDVTTERAAEMERLEAVTLFELGFDAAPIGMLLNDAQDGRFLRVNDALCRLLGRPREELLGMTVQEVTHPDDRVHDDEARQGVADGQDSHYETEKRYVRPDGTVVWVAVHVGAVRRPDDSILAYFGQAVDITGRKAREAQQQRDASDAVWLGRIRDALDEDRLVLYSQPIIDLSTGATIKHELLLRMRAEDGSIVAPGAFLGVAERYGLISEIDRWVIRQAAAIGASGVAAQFNLSGASIGVPDVLTEIESAIEDTGVDPGLLTIEVTETAMMERLEPGRIFAERVTSLGCHIALDDFGTGWAGLSYLKHLPVEQLKIDMEFVRELVNNDADERLVRGIVGLAREFGLSTTAEGIEDEETLVKLRELGVDHGQGYLFGRPQPFAGATEPEAATVSEPAEAAPASDASVDVVRAVFDAFSRRDRLGALDLFDPDATVRTFATAQLANRTAPYQGHSGIGTYLDDVASVWDNLVFTPTAFHEAGSTIIVFGTATSTSGGQAQTVDVLWVWRLRAGLVTSVEVFRSAPPS